MPRDADGSSVGAFALAIPEIDSRPLETALHLRDHLSVLVRDVPSFTYVLFQVIEFTTGKVLPGSGTNRFELITLVVVKGLGRARGVG